MFDKHICIFVFTFFKTSRSEAQEEENYGDTGRPKNPSAETVNEASHQMEAEFQHRPHVLRRF